MVYRPSIDSEKCFVLMPFSAMHFEYFEGILAPVARDVGLNAVKADDIYGTAPIMSDIWRSIWSARVVVADVTGKNPNVNYELGLCHALGVPTIIITQELADVPFDYRHLRCIVYDTRRVDWQQRLRSDLTKTLKAVLDGSNVSSDLPWPYDTVALQASVVTSPFVSAESARELITRGINQGRDAVASALGLHGTAVSVSSNFGGQKSQRSGVAIASALSSANPIVQLGLEQVIAATREASAELGDGTKATAILMAEMVSAGFEALKNGISLRDLIHEMDKAIEAAVNWLRDAIIPLDANQIIAVATTAALGDKLVGRLLDEAVSKAGMDGVILVEDSPELNSTIDVKEGMYFNRGFISPRFINDEPNQLVILDDVYLLLCAERILSMQKLLPIMDQVARSRKSLVIIAEDVDSEALETLIVNSERNTLPAVAIRAPGYANRPDLLEDIGVLTGGVVTRYASMLETIVLSQLGYAIRVVVSRDSTWIKNGAGKADLIESRAAGIRRQIVVSRDPNEKEKLQERLAKLTGATVVIRVGGASESDREGRRYRTIAAMYSTHSAGKGGTVAGGGAALWHARSALQAGLFGIGGTVVSQALAALIETHIRNARVPIDEITNKLGDHVGLGFDSETRTIKDVRSHGIIDSAIVVIRGLQIAFGRAREVLQTGAWEIGKTKFSASPESISFTPFDR